jgi:cytoskeletal protein CcmA (bactofilin family)
MSIFRRDNPSAATAASGGASESGGSQKRRLTHVAPGTRIQGEVSGPTELLIEGEIEGEVRLDAAVTVGAEGVVRGPIAAQVVRVGGKVVGNVTASDRVEVSASGSVEGDLSAPRIIVAEGAFFRGRVEMTGDGGREPNRPRSDGEPQPKQPADAEG